MFSPQKLKNKTHDKVKLLQSDTAMLQYSEASQVNLLSSKNTDTY